MPNTTLAADATTMPRRLFLAAGPAAAVFTALHGSARGMASQDNLDALNSLIAAHEKARQEFELAIDELDAAEPNPKDRVVGLLGCNYPAPTFEAEALGSGWD